MAEVGMGNLYDMNKSVIMQLPPITEEELNKAMNDIYHFFTIKGNMYHCSYFMLLCHEDRNYTIFSIKPNIISAPTAVAELKTCLKNRGQIISIERTEDNIAFEIWLKNNEDVYCYYLFPCDSCVIEC